MASGTAGAQMEPIAGVSLEQFAVISKGLAAHGYDQSKAVEVAASHSVSADNWQQAMDGWNDRIKGNPAIPSSSTSSTWEHAGHAEAGQRDQQELGRRRPAW